MKCNTDMSIRKKHKEIKRLIEAFEEEASKFHDLSFSIYYVTQKNSNAKDSFHENNHAIVLWQYQGLLGVDKTAEDFATDIESSDLQWGVRGAELSLFGVIEGETVNQFVRMAKRAGSIFNEKESREIQRRIVDEITSNLKNKENGKPIIGTNSNALSIWLNYLLYHLSIDNPSRVNVKRVEPDPYTLSLLALERLLEDSNINKSDRSIKNISDINFKVALSFPGEKRLFVSKVADKLKEKFGENSVFYDYDYQSQLAIPNLDTLLQKVYRNNSELIVVFLCSEYSEKEWCGLEWRAIRDIIKSKEDKRIMFVRFDDASVDGVFSIDGYIDGNKFQPSEVTAFIMERIELNDM